jgi:hypothetical protein
MPTLTRILNLFFCQHIRYTFPQTDERTGLTTVVCTDCGRRFHYDWSTMQKGREVREGFEEPGPVPQRATGLSLQPRKKEA